MLGTLVWDTIHGRDAARETPVERWGGIAYALSAFELAGPPGWEICPIVKVGSDMRAEALRFFRGLDRTGSLDGVRFVDAPNNRVELRYRDRERRTERLRGGVPGWEWQELAPLAEECDALYVNFIAGWELELDGAARLAGLGESPVYADLHSIFLEVGPEGIRRRRRPEGGAEWLRCFDVVQMNEEELRCLAGEERDPWRAAAGFVGSRPRAIFVTRGERGVRWVPPEPDFRGLPLGPADTERSGESGPGTAEGPPRDAASRGEYEIPVAEEPQPEVVEGADPTGCGDVWGITCFGGLLSGSGPRGAVRRANRVASHNARLQGAAALARLRDEGAILEGEERT